MSLVQSSGSHSWPDVVSIGDRQLFNIALDRAASVLSGGGLAVVPSETVYGLAANALEERAVSRIYEVKGRPSSNPLIVHVSDLEMARFCTSAWPETAASLARMYWPGPLTIVLPKSDVIPAIVTAGGGTVAIRWPGHPFFRELIARCGFPIAAPSANFANATSPTTVDHVLKGVGRLVPIVVDGGPCNVGIESTVVDLSHEVPIVLRAGMISRTALESTLGVSIDRLGEVSPAKGTSSQKPLRSPGLLERHYSPRARIFVAAWKSGNDLKRFCEANKIATDSTLVMSHEHPPEGFPNVSVIPQDPEAYARALYSDWHRADELGLQFIIVEALPAGDAWDGVRDRLLRACALDSKVR